MADSRAATDSAAGQNGSNTVPLEDDNAGTPPLETKTSSVYGIETEETDEERLRAAEDQDPLLQPQAKEEEAVPELVKPSPSPTTSLPSPSAQATIPQQPQKQPPQQPKAQPQQQREQGDLATANRLLRTCRNKIDQLTKQLSMEKEENLRLREDFNKYKVRIELARKNTEMEMNSLSEVNLKFKQYNVVSHDVQAELDALKRRYEQIDRERVQARLEVSRLKEELAAERNARVMAEESLSDCQRTLDKVRPEALAQARAETTEEVNEVRREFRQFREYHVRALEEKDAEIVRARTSTEAATELAYLRDVIVKYMAAANDPVARSNMETAIGTVLKFNQAELDYIKERRRTNGEQSWLSALGI